jgi:hypothetical protein
MKEAIRPQGSEKLLSQCLQLMKIIVVNRAAFLVVRDDVVWFGTTMT